MPGGGKLVLSRTGNGTCSSDLQVNSTLPTFVRFLSVGGAAPYFFTGVRSSKHEPGTGRRATHRGAYLRHGLVDCQCSQASALQRGAGRLAPGGYRDRKSTRLNSSHANISYAVF